jgi:hypothetical protein
MKARYAVRASDARMFLLASAVAAFAENSIVLARAALACESIVVRQQRSPLGRGRRNIVRKRPMKVTAQANSTIQTKIRGTQSTNCSDGVGELKGADRIHTEGKNDAPVERVIGQLEARQTCRHQPRITSLGSHQVPVAQKNIVKPRRNGSMLCNNGDAVLRG